MRNMIEKDSCIEYKCPVIGDKPSRAIETMCCAICSKRIAHGCEVYDKIMDDWKSQQVLEFMRGD